MRIKRDLKINGKLYKAGENVPALSVFPFFLIHMLVFGGSGFLMAYFSDVEILFLYAHGGIAIIVYLAFYVAIFGLDAVKWMFMNAAIGIFGIYAELKFVLKHFNKNISDFPWFVHLVPFTYYVLYTFLIYQTVLSIFAADEKPQNKKYVEAAYVSISLLTYFIIFQFS